MMKSASDQQSASKEDINMADAANSEATDNNESHATGQADAASTKAPNDMKSQEESQQSKDGGSPSDLSGAKRARSSPTQDGDDEATPPPAKKPATEEASTADSVPSATDTAKKPAESKKPATEEASTTDSVPSATDSTKKPGAPNQPKSTRTGPGKGRPRAGKGPKLPHAVPPMIPQLKAAGEYAPQLLLQRRRELDNYPVVPLQPHVIGGLRDQIEKYKQCNCKRSNCLKLYCDCFQMAIYCSPLCKCDSCKNTVDNTAERNHAVEYLLHKNHSAFRPRLAGGTTSVSKSSLALTAGTPSKSGCNCKKSNCLKMYCDCFSSSVCCTVNCRCMDCQNTADNPMRERLLAKRRKKATAKAKTAAKAKAKTAATAQEQPQLMGHMAMIGDQNRVTAGGSSENKKTDVKRTSPMASSLPTDLPNVEATAALATDAITRGVDLFLPPSTYSIPMHIPESKGVWGALAFGKASDDTLVFVEGSSSPSSEPTSPTPAIASTKSRGYAVPVTELERNWGVELGRLEATFDAMHWALLSEGSREIMGFVPDGVTTARSKYATRNGLADLNKLIDASKKAESRARDWLDNKKIKSSHQGDAGPEDVEMADAIDAPVTSAEEESLLLCTEDATLNTHDKPLSESAARQLTILCAQDTALLSELTAMIRRKTMEFTAERIRLVSEASKLHKERLSGVRKMRPKSSTTDSSAKKSPISSSVPTTQDKPRKHKYHMYPKNGPDPRKG